MAAEKQRILFVDDEASLLAGLQNLLRKERKRWDMVFVPSGEAALQELAKAPFDVIVSDMRMPRMDGAELLAEVKRLYPATSRIVLSGHAEPEAVMRAVPVAHQYLAKPCDEAGLKMAIDRSCSLRSLLVDEKLRRIVGQLEKLPSAPTIYLELTRALADPRTGTRDLATIIERDPAMTLKVLQLVNSAYFGLPRAIASISQAVAFLGVDLLKGLAASVQIFATLPGGAAGGAHLEQLQSRGLEAALLAKKLGASLGKAADEAFTAALIADVGQLVVAHAMPDVFREVMSAPGQALELEHERLGITHAEIGAYLLGIWGLPLVMVESVAHHHHPEHLGPGQGVAAAVAIAQRIVGDATQADDGLVDETLARVGLAAEAPAWKRTIAERS